MEVRYKKDLKNSYLILSADEEAVKSYQMQMITRNKIEGLLPCQLKSEEENRFCYYDISSRQSLQHMYTCSEMGYEELKDVLTGIYIILQKLEKYLLCSTCLILEPEYIYMDIERESICLVYFPGYDEDSFAAIRHLAEYILSRVNHADEQAVKLAYYFYQCAREENFSFQHLAEYIEKQNAQLFDITGNDLPEEESLEKRSFPFSNGSIKPAAQYESLDEIQQEGYRTKKMPIVQIRKKRILCVGVIGTIVLIAVCLYVFMNYKFQVQEMAVCAGVIAACYAVLVMAYVNYGRMGISKAEEEKTEETAAVVDSYESIQTDANAYGNTVFLGHPTVVVHHWLEGEYADNKLYFEIDKEQIMIGKMKGKVDIELSDMSISRIHAKIYQRDDKVMLKDLNSTNGTYKNGVILQPEETVELKPLDEVRFGKICLTYH